MAKLYISEYVTQPLVSNGQMSGMGQEPNLVNQTPVAIGGSSVSSAAFNAKTRFVRIHTDAICSIKFGGTAATANDARMAANTTEYFGVLPGDSVAVITNT